MEEPVEIDENCMKQRSYNISITVVMLNFMIEITGILGTDSFTHRRSETWNDQIMLAYMLSGS